MLKHSELSGRIVDAAIAVHRALGPGLLESVYVSCLAHELRSRGLKVEREWSVPLRYKGLEILHAYRADLLVDDLVIVEAKALDQLLPQHSAQLLTYLRLSGKPLGLLFNFNMPLLKQGIRRLVWDAPVDGCLATMMEVEAGPPDRPVPM